MKAEESRLLNWIRFFFWVHKGLMISFLFVNFLLFIFIFFYIYYFHKFFLNLVAMNTQAPSSSLK